MTRKEAEILVNEILLKSNTESKIELLIETVLIYENRIEKLEERLNKSNNTIIKLTCEHKALIDIGDGYKTNYCPECNQYNV